MRIVLTRPDKQRQETWRRWFAWYPVFAESADDASGSVLIWLRYVERKEAQGYGTWGWRHRETV